MTKEEQKRTCKVSELYQEGFTTAEIATKLRMNKREVLRLLSYYLAFKKYKETDI